MQQDKKKKKKTTCFWDTSLELNLHINGSLHPGVPQSMQFYSLHFPHTSLLRVLSGGTIFSNAQTWETS